jgi:hypothetical protein
MPVKNSKQSSTKTETPVALKVEEIKLEVSETNKKVDVVPQKGGKKAAVKSEVEAEVKAEAEAEVKVKVEETEPVVQKTAQKGGKKVAKSEVTEEVKVEEPTTEPVTQKGGKKNLKTEVKVEETKAESVTQKGGKKVTKTEETKVETTVQKGGKKVKVEKVPKTPKTPKPTKEDDAEESEDLVARRIRSFKVKLPGKEEFEGRFTGLTPYQAANKALSKYFREGSDPKAEITFSICESTRKSKKGVYTYAGKRLKLETPVTYKIQDGREIVKNFKNFLKKIKKSDTVTV